MAESINSYLRKLRKMGEQVLPETVAATVNAVATAAHNRSRQNIRERFTIRNTYTERSLRYWKANPKAKIARINAVTGTISPYLPVQETGGAIKAKKAKVPIPTLAARSGSRSKVIPKRFRMNALGNLDDRGGKFFAAKFRKPGIFYRRTKRKIVMVRDLSRRSVKVKARRWHSDAVRRVARPGWWDEAFRREAERVFAARVRPS